MNESVVAEKVRVNLNNRKYERNQWKLCVKWNFSNYNNRNVSAMWTSIASSGPNTAPAFFLEMHLKC